MLLLLNCDLHACAGSPDAPDPPVISNYSKDGMTAVWKEPKNDGGKAIAGYYLERRETSSNHWHKLNRKSINELQMRVTGLSEGIEYEFRVIAENSCGFSEPSNPSTPQISQDPKCKNRFILIFGHFFMLHV